MIKPLIACAALALLAGCSQHHAAASDDATTPPAGVAKIMGGEKLTSYIDLRTLSTYQGNPRLRRLYMINNYSEQKTIHSKPPVQIASSRAINVINCDTRQRAVFERVYFTQPWAEGQVVSIRDEIGQWESFDQHSIMDMLAGMVCRIDPQRLKPEPAKESRKPLLDI